MLRKAEIQFMRPRPETGNGRLATYGHPALKDPAIMPPVRATGRFIVQVLRLLLVICALVSGGAALAVNKTCTGGNMSVGASWGGTVPVAADVLRINGACVVDNAFANLAYGTLEVSRGAAGTLSWPVGGTATLNVTTVLTGTFGAGTINMTNGGTLQITTSWTSTNTTLTPGTGTVNWNVTGAASTLPTFAGVNTYNNLTITATGRVASLGQATTVNGDLLISAGTLSVSGSNFALNVKGDFTNNGTGFTRGTGTVTMSGTAAQAIQGSTTTTFNNLTITNTSAAVSLSLTTNIVNVAGTLNMNGAATLLTPAAAVVINSAAAAGTITGTGTVQVTRTLATADYSSQYKFTTNTLTNLTVEYIGTATQVVSALTYGSGTGGGLKISNTSAAVTAAANFAVNGTLTMNGATTVLTPAAAVIVSGTGTLTGTGTVQVTRTAATADFSSQYTITNKTLTNLTVEYAGAAAQTVSALTYGGLKINNASGVTLAANATVNATLTLASGNITTGASTMITTTTCASSVSRTSGHVVGNLQKAIPAGASTCTFEVGSGTNYTPVVTAFVAGTTAGNMTASTTGSDHPSIGSSAINSAASVNRYWTLTNGGGTLVGLPAAGYTATFNFINGSPVDFDAGADPTKFMVQRFSGGSWFATTVNATCTATPGTNLCEQVNGIAAFGAFAIGETTYTSGNAGWFNVFESSTAANAFLGKIYTKIVGTAFNLDVVAVNASRTGVNPGYGTNPITVELLNASDNSGANTAQTDCRSSWTLIPSQSFSFSPAWASSRATVAIPLQSSAAREVRIRVTQGTLVGCSTDNFSIRPTGFTVSSTNATQTDSSGTPAIKAGASFNLTAASVAGYNGTPSVDNTAGMVVGTPNAGTIGGSFGAALVGTGTATGASFTYSEVGNFGLSTNAVFDSSFSSVDSSPSDCNVGFSNTLDGAGRYGCSIGSTAIAQTLGLSGFGRFIPDNFNVTYPGPAPTFTAGCGTFSYVGTAFAYGTAPVITVTARNSSNATTTNYAGSYMKFSSTAGASLNQAPYNTQGGRYSRFDALGGGTTPALDTSQLPATTADPVIGAFTNGVGTLTFSSGGGLAFTRSLTTPNAPFNADIAVALNVIDGDAITYAGNPASFGAATAGNGIAFSGGKPMRFGWLKLSNAVGSEKSPLQIPIQAQYWSGNSWVLNANDSCTPIPATRVALSNYRDKSGTPPTPNWSTTPTGPGTLSAGQGAITLAAPVPVGGTGSVDVAINLGTATTDASCLASHPAMTAPALSLAYLRGMNGSCAASSIFAADPSSTATFGVYSPETRKAVHIRELF
jgi:hypothetical protein